jgi:hypothetical protein
MVYPNSESTQARRRDLLFIVDWSIKMNGHPENLQGLSIPAMKTKKMFRQDVGLMPVGWSSLVTGWWSI